MCNVELSLSRGGGRKKKEKKEMKNVFLQEKNRTKYGKNVLVGRSARAAAKRYLPFLLHNARSLPSALSHALSQSDMVSFSCLNHIVETHFKGDLRTICRFSYMKVYKLITLGTKFKTLLSLGRKITMFSKFITNYIEQG